MLTIESMDRHKGGTYVCSANNGVGKPASSQVILHVLCKLNFVNILFLLMHFILLFKSVFSVNNMNEISNNFMFFVFNEVSQFYDEKQRLNKILIFTFFFLYEKLIIRLHEIVDF